MQESCARIREGWRVLLKSVSAANVANRDSHSTDAYGSDGVVVAKVDADAHRALGGRFGVKGFPTLKWFPRGTTEPEDYEGGRSAEDMMNFINERTGLNKRLKTEPTAVVHLDESNFDQVVKDPNANVLVEFYAPVRCTPALTLNHV